MAEQYGMDAEKFKEFMAPEEHDGFKRDLEVKKALEFIYENGVAVEKKAEEKKAEEKKPAAKKTAAKKPAAKKEEAAEEKPAKKPAAKKTAAKKADEDK